MIIDAHQHYWQPARGDYDWMPMDNPVLARPYGPDDLTPERTACGVTQTVLVQAAATVHETEYMLGLADASPSIAGIVGWVDFEDPSQRHTLERLAQHPKFKGVGPMIQDIPDVNWMLRDEVQWAYQAICDLDLTFDALGFPPHLENFLTLFQRYPEMRVVIDHCMKPQIREHAPTGFKHWADGMSQLADATGAYCKLSGLITEAEAAWTVDALRPYAHHVLAAFGPGRVMWGSDWPVCRLRAEYATWFETARQLTADLDPDSQAQVFGHTAARFYRLSV
jgi:L-fuconolactonase